MAISLTHNFTSTIPDGGDTTIVQPSNWNAEHTLVCATGKILGRTTAGTGAVEEITAPAGSLVGTTATQTLTNKTLTTPTLTTPNINSASVSTVSGTAPLFMARAWVNFNGSGTVAINGSGNVTSITDGGVGTYTVNITTAMADTNYAAVASCGFNASFTAQFARIDLGSKTTSAAGLVTVDVSATARDSDNVSVSIFR